jgi:hypothetical protein
VGQGGQVRRHQGGLIAGTLARYPPRVDDTLLRCIIFFGCESGVGQTPPPSFVTSMEELASIPDADEANKESPWSLGFLSCSS